MRFSITYFSLTVALFLIEVFIALYVHDNFIRPYFGDVLVVILIYCFVKTFYDFNYLITAFAVLLFAFFVEWTQYVNLIGTLGWQDSRFAKIVMGNSFAWEDMLAYLAGFLFIIGVEALVRNRKSNQTIQSDS